MPDVRMTLDQGHWLADFEGIGQARCVSAQLGAGLSEKARHTGWPSLCQIVAAPQSSLRSSMADRIGSWMHFAQLRLWNAFRIPHAHRCPKLDRLASTLDRECNRQVARCKCLCTCNEFMAEVG
jgi:hypothetical protein